VLPKRDEVLAIMKRLIEGELTPEAVSKWATPFVLADDVDVVDWPVWEAIKTLVIADACGGDGRRYLYRQADFIAWERELRGAA
jgi:hypothetical protein